MQRTASSSSSPAAEDRLVRIPLKRLHPHPSSASRMSEEQLTKLLANIQREGRYPPPIVRPHPDLPDDWQTLDGLQRLEVLGRLGEAEALCFNWPCDDETALVLLATLNRLEGADVPALRAELLRELSQLVSVEELALLLPEDSGLIADSLGFSTLDSDALLCELEAATDAADREAPRLISFAVVPGDEAKIERAISLASAELDGPNKRGRALALIAAAYLGANDA